MFKVIFIVTGGRLENTQKNHPRGGDVHTADRPSPHHTLYPSRLPTAFLLVYSATTSAGGGFSDCLMQLVCIALGIVAALVISRLDYEFIASLWPFLAGVSVLLVLLTFTSLGYSVPGTDDQNWLEIPLGPKTFLFQPSELLKIAFIITFSFHLSRVREHINRPLTVLLLCAHGLFPALLVFAQGTTAPPPSSSAFSWG